MRLVQFLLALGCVAAGGPSAIRGAEAPNILILVADDLGWADVGYHGSPIPTPNIDRLVREGLELDQHYVAPVCTPTRAALMTGRYWSRFGVTTPSNTQVLPTETITLAAALQGLDYETAMMGKWHLGSLSKWGPRQFGFDHSYGALAGGVGPWTHRYKKGIYSRTWHRDDLLLRSEEGHVTDLLTAAAVAFLERKRLRPFLLYVPFTAPHHPLDEPPEYVKRGRAADARRPQYAASVSHLDDSIGKILEALRKSGRGADTLVLFFSDNGGNIQAADSDNRNYAGEYSEGELLGRNDPLRGRKTQLYEGGIRTPACLWWPGKLSPGKFTAPLHVIDWMPTLCQLTGYVAPRDLSWDGVDVWPAVAAGAPAPQRHLYWQGPGRRSAAIRDEDSWKLIVHRDDAGNLKHELFKLDMDPGEVRNLEARHPNLVERLRGLLATEEARDDAVGER